MSDNERSCGTCGCYEEFTGPAYGHCYARPPTRLQAYRPGYNDGPANYGRPIVFPTNYCRHDWVPRVPAELPQETKDGLDEVATTCHGVPICTLADLSHRALSVLQRAGIATPDELAGFTEEDAASLKGAGPAVMAEFRQLLQANGLSFQEPAPVSETT